MQIDLEDCIAVAIKRDSIIDPVKAALSRCSHYTVRSFRATVAASLDRHDISRLALSAAICEHNGFVARALSGHAPASTLRLAKLLGCSVAGDDLSAVIKPLAAVRIAA